MTRPQPLKLGRLWIRPAIILAAARWCCWRRSPARIMRAPFADGLGWLVLAGRWARSAAGIGAAHAIEVHPEDGTLMVTGGQAAMLVLVVLVLLRLGLRTGLAMEAKPGIWMRC